MGTDSAKAAGELSGNSAFAVVKQPARHGMRLEPIIVLVLALPHKNKPVKLIQENVDPTEGIGHVPEPGIWDVPVK